MKKHGLGENEDIVKIFSCRDLNPVAGSAWDSYLQI